MTAALEVTFVTSLLLALVFGTPIVAPANAGVNVWTTLGPSGDVRAIAIDPTIPAVVYATSGTSVFKTVDGGANWFNAGSLTAGSFINAFAVDWRNPSTSYAGTWNSGLFKSTDGGTNWTAINAGIYPPVGLFITRTLAIDPVDPATVYVGTSQGGFVTADGGMNWTMLNGGGASGLGDVWAIAIDPRDTTTVFVGAQAYGHATVWKGFRYDGGINWSRVAEWMEHPLVAALAVDPTNPCLSCQVVCASVWNDGGYLSTDGGSHWTSLWNYGQLTAFGITSFAVHPATPWSAYAGTTAGEVWESVNHFSTWSLLGANPGFYINSLAVTPSGPTTIYAATQNGLWSITLGALAITTPCPLPVASAGEYYQADLSAIGGIPPLMWSIAGGSLPPGLAVLNDPYDNVSAVSGVPETSGTFDFTLRVTDSALRSNDVSCSIMVARRVRRHLVRGP